jgi:S1-C subfamily serine protease
MLAVCLEFAAPFLVGIAAILWLSLVKPPGAAEVNPAVSQANGEASNTIAKGSKPHQAAPAEQTVDSEVDEFDAVAKFSPIPSDLPLLETLPAISYQWAPNAEIAYRFELSASQSGQITHYEGEVVYRPSGRLKSTVVPEVEFGSGTGFVVRGDGIIATCAHVVRGATKITARLGDQEHTARVIG